MKIGKLVSSMKLIQLDTISSQRSLPTQHVCSVSHNRLIRVCHVDYDRDIALIVLDKSSSTGKLVAAARLTKEHGRNTAEFSMLVADDYQGASCMCVCCFFISCIWLLISLYFDHLHVWYFRRRTRREAVAGTH